MARALATGSGLARREIGCPHRVRRRRRVRSSSCFRAEQQWRRRLPDCSRGASLDAAGTVKSGRPRASTGRRPGSGFLHGRSGSHAATGVKILQTVIRRTARGVTFVRFEDDDDARRGHDSGPRDVALDRLAGRVTSDDEGRRRARRALRASPPAPGFERRRLLEYVAVAAIVVLRVHDRSPKSRCASGASAWCAVLELVEDGAAAVVVVLACFPVRIDGGGGHGLIARCAARPLERALDGAGTCVWTEFQAPRHRPQHNSLVDFRTGRSSDGAEDGGRALGRWRHGSPAGSGLELAVLDRQG